LRQAEDEMRRAVDQHDMAAANRAAEQLRQAMSLLGGMQQQDASRQIDSLAHEAGRLASQQRQQAQRLQGLQAARRSSQALGAGQRGAGANARAGSAGPVEAFIADRQQLADDLAKLTQQMRDAQRAALERSHGAASQLRDALGDLEQADTETQLQRSADQLRRGYAPLTDTAETEIASELQHLQDQLSAAQRAMTDGQPSSSDGALAAVERLRSRLAALDQNRGGGSGSAGAGQLAGPVNGGGRGDNSGGPVNGGWNTGNNSELPQPVAPDTRAPSGATTQAYREGLEDLDQLRRSVGEDPQARRQVEELIRSMQKLDPRRFPGNPAMVAELHARVLSGVDRLELQLRHEPDDTLPAQVRADSPQPIPAGYQGAAAEYFRRLSRNP
jgi:hypothetical protein